MKTSRDFELEFLRGIRKETGRGAGEWMQIIDIFPGKDRENIIGFLQDKYTLSYRQSVLLINLYLNGGETVYS